MADIGVLIDDDYVGINDEDCQTIPSQCYTTISKGKVQQTDSKCAYCCWKITEILKAFVLPLIYTLVVAGCGVYCWQILSNYSHSLRHPIETLSYVYTEKYEPPGIAVFMFDNATFVKCEKSFYYDTEKLKKGQKQDRWKRDRKGRGQTSLSSLMRFNKDIETQPCLFSTISDYESIMARQNTSMMVFQGPGNVMRREHMKIHFKVDQQKIDPDIGFLEYFPFANFSEWTNDFNSSQTYLQDRERLQDIWPLAMGFTTYSRLSIRVFKSMDIDHLSGNNTSASTNRLNDHRTIFNPVNDIVKFLPPDTANYTPHYENMFAIFEWRDSEYEVIEDVVTMNLVTTIGLMVTAVLTLLRMMDLTKVILRRQRIRYNQNRLSFYSICTCCKKN
ncbi:proton-activated chloride channel-like [Bolinopsis microptera]|uniref:proton-activated chloride channel-like n=1 Tax=Bolinopsis microptera TaxID=2820187 RepID=UPI003078AD15